MARNLTVGFVGLGSQGAPMARRIAEAGFPLTLWARRPDALTPFADTGARTADDLAGLAAAVEHVGVCVVDDAGVREVCAALLPAMRAGARLAIHSTVHPDTCLALAAEAAARGVALIDAPVSGGAPAAAAGTLTVMAGGDADAVAAARPVFESFARLVTHLGGVGAGQHAKLVNNALMAANLAMADAALGAGAALGIDRAALIELLKASSGHSAAFDVRARMPAASAFGHGARLLTKDVRLLGEVLGDEPDFRRLEAAAAPFLAGIVAA